MKLALALLALALTACSVNHKSQEFACTKQADCAGHPNTVCDNGFCVVPGSIDAPGSPKDAPKGMTDGSNGDVCPPGCSSCNTAQKTCTIDCSLTSKVNCQQAVNCPTGYHCDIQCKDQNDCRSGVSCTDAASCTVECSGPSSCRGIACGPGPCDVTCSGINSCRGIDCNNSCACDVLCTGASSCSTAVTCTAPLCQSGLGCSSVIAGCHSC